ncbi:MAG: hypothetical protein KIT09_11235, partial [Bryobacteraceae bacterium]|nr:hypothetical protein [Bryobacteraceae bacterium]
ELLGSQPSTVGDFLRLMRSLSDEGEMMDRSRDLLKEWREPRSLSLRWLSSEHPITAAEILYLIMRSSDEDVFRRLAMDLPNEKPAIRMMLDRSPALLLERLAELAQRTQNRQLLFEIHLRARRLLPRTVSAVYEHNNPRNI